MKPAWVHRRDLRRLVRLLDDLPTGACAVATCADAELREALEGELAVEPGVEGVVAVNAKGVASPWRAVMAERRPGRVIHTVHSFSNANWRVLNLAREAIAGARIHLLIWLDGLAELEPFAAAAPDLWSRIDGVWYFLSAADFDAGVGAPEPAPGLEEEFAQLERDKRQANGWPISGIVEAQSAIRFNQGRFVEALALAEQGLTERSLFHGRDGLVACKAAALRMLGRHDELRALIQSSWTAEGARHARRLLLATTGFHREVIRDLSGDRRPHARFTRALCAFELGHIRTALAEFAAIEMDETEPLLSTMARQMRARTSAESGDWVTWLRSLSAATRELRAHGSHGTAVASIQVLAHAYTSLGLLEPAEEWRRAAVAEERRRGDPRFLATSLRNLARLLWDQPDREAAAVQAWNEADRVLSDGLAGEVEPHARIRLQLALASAATTDIARHGGRDPTPAARERLLEAECEHGSSRDRLGRVWWNRAELEQVAGAFGEAERYTLLALGWARDRLDPDGPTRRGPEHLAQLLVLLTEVRRAGGLPGALESAVDAVREARLSGSVWLLRDAHRAQARALDATNQTSLATRAWSAALRVLRTEGLRPAELQLLHDIAERPLPARGRSAALRAREAAAHQAWALALQLAQPREEARALRNLAVIRRDRDTALARIHLEEALEIVTHVGPRALASEVRALHAAWVLAG